MLIRILFILSILVSNPVYAIETFSGVDMQKVTIQGRVYEVPVGNEQRKNDIYYLKKAMNGDKEALEIFLGGSEQRIFYIGQHSPLWLTADINGNFEVLEPGGINVQQN